jgi:hypothetical protein
MEIHGVVSEMKHADGQTDTTLSVFQFLHALVQITHNNEICFFSSL